MVVKTLHIALAFLCVFLAGIQVSKADNYDDIINSSNQRLSSDVNAMIGLPPNGDPDAIKDLETLFSPTATIQLMAVEGAVPNITIKYATGIKEIIQWYATGSINTRASLGSFARKTYKLDKSKAANGVLTEFGFENYMVPFEMAGDKDVHYYLARGDYAAQWAVKQDNTWWITSLTYGRTTGYSGDTVDFLLQFLGIFQQTWSTYSTLNETEWMSVVLNLFTDDAVFLPQMGYCNNPSQVYRGQDQLKQAFTAMLAAKDNFSALAVDYFEGDIDNPKPNVLPLLATGTYFLSGSNQKNPQGQFVIKVKKDEWDHPTKYGWQIPYLTMSLC